MQAHSYVQANRILHKLDAFLSSECYGRGSDGESRQGSCDPERLAHITDEIRKAHESLEWLLDDNHLEERMLPAFMR